MDENLIIDDDYVLDVGKYAAPRRAKALEEILTAYITILEEICAEAIPSGEIADSTAAFAACASLLKGKLTEISDSIKTASGGFITAVNEADSYLF